MTEVFPAYAGMFREARGHVSAHLGFPRVCGDVPIADSIESTTRAFSPRMRGCSSEDWHVTVGGRVFPAYAGMFRRLDDVVPCPAGFPRVCGDVPGLRDHAHGGFKFSPRMRGCSVGAVGQGAG